MRTFGWLAALAAASWMAGCAPAQNEGTQGGYQEQVARGKYLVTVAGCHDCHTPHRFGPKGLELDENRLLAGHPQELDAGVQAAASGAWVIATNEALTAWSGPWGVSYAANLTPDAETGLGSWTEDVFIRAMREGKHMGTGRPIMPPMPWPNVAHFSDDDLKAVFAYLRTLPPVKNRVPDPQIAPPPAPAEAPDGAGQASTGHAL